MYLLDTNVVSELRRADKADRRVLAWANRVPATDMFLSCISILELEIGVLLIARRDHGQGEILKRWIEQRVLAPFADRILPVDAEVARRCAALHVPDARPDRDSLIAATAIVHRLTVVTRNVAGFEPMSSRVFNPWQAA